MESEMVSWSGAKITAKIIESGLPSTNDSIGSETEKHYEKNNARITNSKSLIINLIRIKRKKIKKFLLKNLEIKSRHSHICIINSIETLIVH